MAREVFTHVGLACEHRARAVGDVDAPEELIDMRE
jgi:hypothetical protein